jgi:hypothetical protein
VQGDVVQSKDDAFSTTPEQEAPMLKKIALGGVVLLAFAYSLSLATAMTPRAKGDKGTMNPQTPAPHGWCLPPGTHC